MRFAVKTARCAQNTSPGLLTAFRALPIHDRRRVRALVFRRGYPLHKAMDIPPVWLDSHLRYGYQYHRPWSAVKSCVVVMTVFLLVFAAFSIFWRV